MGGPEINLEASKRPRMRVASAIKISLQISKNVRMLNQYGGDGGGEKNVPVICPIKSGSQGGAVETLHLLGMR